MDVKSLMQDLSTGEKNTVAYDKNYSNKEIVSAMSSVMNFLISDIFSLSPEETLWVGYHLNQIFKPLEDLEPSIILAAVDRELKTSEYSDRLAHKNNTPMFAESVYLTPDKTVKAASLSEWVQGLSEIALAAYPDARPMIVSMIVGSLHGY